MPRQSKKAQVTRTATAIRTRSQTHGLVLDGKSTTIVQQTRIPLSPKHVRPNFNSNQEDELLLSPRFTLQAAACEASVSQIGTKRSHSDAQLSTPLKPSPSIHHSQPYNNDAAKSPSLLGPPQKKFKLFTPVIEYIRSPRASLLPNSTPSRQINPSFQVLRDAPCEEEARPKMTFEFTHE